MAYRLIPKHIGVKKRAASIYGTSYRWFREIVFGEFNNNEALKKGFESTKEAVKNTADEYKEAYNKILEIEKKIK